MRTMLFIFFALATMTPLVKAQIVFEHTYSDHAYTVNLPVSGVKYFHLNKSTGKLEIHNTDHTIWKSVNLDVPAGYVLSTADQVSENLFTTDGKVCAIYTYYRTSPSVEYHLRVINEDGTVLLSVTDGVFSYVSEVSPGNPKLLVHCIDYVASTYTTKVYDLPGQFVSVSGLNEPVFDPPYPNPGMDFVNIPINLPAGYGKAGLVIRESCGREVIRIPLQPGTEVYRLPTSGLMNGMYFFSVESGNTLIQSGKFCIEKGRD